MSSLDASHMLSLFENATEGIILTDSRGTIVLVNPAAARIFGYEAPQLIGKQVEVLVPQRSKQDHVTLRDNFYAHPQNRVMGHGRDLYAVKKDGTEFPVEVSLSHYRKDNELFVIVFIIDITFRKQIENNLARQQQETEKLAQELKKLNIELEANVKQRTANLQEAMARLEKSQKELGAALDKEKELSEIKSRFVSMASHEFRTPLSTILSSASLVAKYSSAEDNEKREKHIHRIKDSVNHMNELLEDFLSLGRLEEGKVSIVPASFDLKVFVTEVADEMQGLLKKEQEIKIDYQGDPVFVSDKRMLKNILLNLLSNASKFSAEGKPISVTVSNTNRLLIITVKDEGIGIPAADLPHLFDSFYRGANASNIQGTGLGLPIIKRYLDLLRGDITVSSKLDEGTGIRVSVPAAEF